FPLSSPGDFEAVQRIARQVDGPMITALARAARPDIDAVWQAVRDAQRNQIHMVLSVSDIHIERKLRSNRKDVLNRGTQAVECAVDGIGERAGNASLEEVVMILRTREKSLGLRTNIDTTRLADVSALVAQETGIPVQPNKAVVGANAFAHASGIHQDGVLKD